MTTKIEWVKNPDGSQGYSLNPIKGKCPVACPYCYARRLYDRFKWNPEIRYIGRESLFNEVLRIPRDKPQKIFLGSTIELFGDWIQPFWMNDIFEVVNTFSFFTFIFLTKQPQNLIKWSPFPDNCRVGVSATNKLQFLTGMHYMEHVKASVKLVSFEPLLETMIGEQPIWEHLENGGISWVIIGQQTPPSVKTSPKMAWIQDILVAASNAGNIPVFMKNNLEPLLVGQWAGWKLRQEYPK